jgi:hypothetical protein
MENIVDNSKETSILKKTLYSILVSIIVLILSFSIYLFTNNWSYTYTQEIPGLKSQEISIFTTKVSVFIYTITIFIFIIAFQLF